MTLFGIYSGPELHYTYPNGDEVSNIDVVFLCRDYSGTLQAQPSEVEGLRFFSADALPECLTPPNRIPLAQWQAQALSRGENSSIPSTFQPKVHKSTAGWGIFQPAVA